VTWFTLLVSFQLSAISHQEIIQSAVILARTVIVRQKSGIKILKAES